VSSRRFFTIRFLHYTYFHLRAMPHSIHSLASRSVVLSLGIVLLSGIASEVQAQVPDAVKQRRAERMEQRSGSHSTGGKASRNPPRRWAVENVG
jgi:hypothetical protein